MQHFTHVAKTLATALLLGLAAQSAAAMPRDRLDCEAAGTTPAIQRCAERAWQEADRELNSAYQDALAQIRAADHLQPAQRAQWTQALRDAQRTWVAYREKDCGEVTGWEWYQGTGMGAASLMCLADKAQRRTIELRERYTAH